MVSTTACNPKRNSGGIYAQKALKFVYESRSYSAFAALGCRWVEVLDSNSCHQERAKIAAATLAEYSSVHTAAFTVDALRQQTVGCLNFLRASRDDVKLKFSQINFIKLKTGAEYAVAVAKNVTTILLFANKLKIIDLVKNGKNYATYLTRFSRIASLHSVSESLWGKTASVALRKKDLTFELAGDIASDMKTALFLGLDLLCYTNVFTPGVVLAFNTATTGYSLWKTIAKKGSAASQVQQAQTECRVLCAT